MVYDHTDPLLGEIGEGGCKLIGASISIEYLGRIDDISGIIEVALNLSA